MYGINSSHTTPYAIGASTAAILLQLSTHLEQVIDPNSIIYSFQGRCSPDLYPVYDLHHLAHIAGIEPIKSAANSGASLRDFYTIYNTSAVMRAAHVLDATAVLVVYTMAKTFE